MTNENEADGIAAELAQLAEKASNANIADFFYSRQAALDAWRLRGRQGPGFSEMVEAIGVALEAYLDASIKPILDELGHRQEVHLRAPWLRQWIVNGGLALARKTAEMAEEARAESGNTSRSRDLDRHPVVLRAWRGMNKATSRLDLLAAAEKARSAGIGPREGQGVVSDSEQGKSEGEFAPAEEQSAERFGRTDNDDATPTRADSPPLVDGRFEIVRSLGRGGMGEVFEARDHRVGRRVAMKQLHSHLLTDQDQASRFQREAQVMARLSHPGLVTLFDTVSEPGKAPILVLEFVDGESLKAILERGPLDAASACSTVAQVARAIAAMHAEGAIHRDLKPGNIMLTTAGQVKVLDLGLVSVTLPEAPNDPTQEILTHPGVIMGTPGYMAPEQARGLEAGRESDVFAIGAILYHALSAKKPFGEGSASRIIQRTINDPPEPLDRVVENLPDGLADLVSACLSKNSRERPECAAVASALESLSMFEPRRPQMVGGERAALNEIDARATGLSPIVIEYEADVPPCFMRWDGQLRAIGDCEVEYTHRVYRVRVRNTSRTKTIRGVRVSIVNVSGVESRHPSVLLGHRLRVMDHNTAEVDINPGASAYFDVASHDLEPELHAINDLRFRYAGAEKETLPTDPGIWWEFALQAQGVDVPPVESHFRLSVDSDNVAQLKAIDTPEPTGIVPSFERRPPFEDNDYADTEYGAGGHIFRIGLMCREPNRSFPVSVVVESMSGGIEGGYLERLLRFKDTGLGEGIVPYDSRACTFVDLLKYPMSTGKPTILYAVKPQFGDQVTITTDFSLRLRISGGPRAVYMTLWFVTNMFGLPQLRTYEVE